MTEDDFLTLSLGERIAWLHSESGPSGFMSHDTFARMLGTSRQTIIDWEKGAQPGERFRKKLAEFSGYPETEFRRREAEESARAMNARRLQSLEDRARRAEAAIRRILVALDRAGIDVPAARAASQSPATSPRSRRATG